MRINYDYGDLETFLAVKESGSFHLAAERLNVSQSSVTRRVRKLEQALATELFERTTRAVKPTLAAKRLQARAEAALVDAREIAQAMRDETVAYDYQRSAVVTVAIVPTIAVRLLCPAIRMMQRSEKIPRLRVLDGSANDVAEAVASGEADFGLCSIATLEPTTLFETLFEDQIVLAVPQGHTLAGKDNIGWAELSDTPLILPARGTGNRLLIDEAMARERLNLHWAFEVGRSSTALELVANGTGAAFVPQTAASGGGYDTCTLASPVISRPVGFLSRVGQADTAAIMSLKEAIRAAV